MDSFAQSLSEKMYEDLQVNILKEGFNVVMEAIAKAMANKNFEKDKECTLKRLHRTIEVMNNKLLENHGELVSESAVQKVKFRMPESKSNIGQIFCQTKNKVKVDDNKVEKKDEISFIDKNEITEFSKEIPNAIEIPRNLFEMKPVDLSHNFGDYHFFTVNINEENEECSYYLTYAERNKYTKRELIALYKGKEALELSELPQNIKTKYNFE